jgi:two-component system OmpR family response regulator
MGMDKSPHILVVDDDREIRSLLTRFLGEHGFRVTTAADGRAMRQILADWRIDLVVLDVMLPGEDGLSLCRRLRAESKIPIIMLTAVGQDTDRIIGLEIGADDYLPKPFNPRELVARIKVVLRRVSADPAIDASQPSGQVRFAGWTFDRTRRRLESPDGVLVDLSGAEFNILAAFIERPNRVLSREQLLDLARSRASIPFDRSIDVQVSRLRQKMELDPKKPGLIKTVRGGGYVLAAEVEHV